MSVKKAAVMGQLAYICLNVWRQACWQRDLAAIKKRLDLQEPYVPQNGTTTH